jgi:hypothetical protein
MNNFLIPTYVDATVPTRLGAFAHGAHAIEHHVIKSTVGCSTGTSTLWGS